MGSTSFAASEETLAGDETLGGSRPAGRSEPALARGESIGRYVVLERIGVGGMGVVHAAYDPELDRKVAIKVLVPRDGTGPEPVARQRLLREAQAMARIRHPHVVAVHDAGVFGERVFVAMEFVEGSTLTAWLAQRQRPLREVLDVFVQAGRGLAAAHARGLVHRDFKPDNVMIGDDGHGHPRAQVMDFGLARAAELQEGEGEEHTLSDDEDLGLAPSQPMSNTLTRVGQVVGTPRFMAPEQHLRGAVDARSDQFSFCVALWLALFERHPFGGETPAELAGRVIAGSLVEPPVVPGVGARLRRALRRGLQPEREQRWPSMEPLLAELEHDPSRSRRRMLVVGAAVVVLGGGIGTQRLLHARAVAGCERAGAGIEPAWDEPARARIREGMLASGLEHAADTFDRLVPWVDRRVTSWAEARTEACLAAEVEGRWDEARGRAAVRCLDDQRGRLVAFLEVLAEADQEAVHGAIPVVAELPEASLCLDEAHLAVVPDAERDDPELAAALLRVWSLMEAGRHEWAHAEMDELRPRLDALGRAPLRVDAELLDSRIDEAEGRYDEAETGYRGAFVSALELGRADLARSASERLAGLLGSIRKEPKEGLWWLDVTAGLSRRAGEDDRGPAMLRSQELRARLELTRGEPERAQQIAEEALAVAESTLGADHPRTASLLEVLSVAHRNQARYQLAVSMARRSVAVREAALGPLHPDVDDGLQSLGETLRQMGEVEEALAVMEQALALAERLYPPGHYRIARAATNVGMVQQELGHSELAREYLDRAIRITEEGLGSEHPDLVAMLVNRGNVHQSLGELDAAIADYERALAIAEAKLEPDDPAHGVILVDLGNSEILRDRPQAALGYYREALEHFERELGREHPHVSVVLTNLANLQGELGHWDEAIATHQRSLEIVEKVHGPDHPDVAYALVGIATVEVAAGRPERALPLAERALRIRSARASSPRDLATARWAVAQALQATHGDDARALELATEALRFFEQDPSNEALPEIREFLGAADEVR
ncbi:MAG: tetratricopeptide repeat protein [Myxococcales bacterium]|nr:tetratricopeptide repeat protein [Myxococcales bacterium]